MTLTERTTRHVGNDNKAARDTHTQFELESHSQVESLVRHVLVRALCVCVALE